MGFARGFEPFFVPRAALIPDQDLELELLEQLRSFAGRNGVAIRVTAGYEQTICDLLGFCV